MIKEKVQTTKDLIDFDLRYILNKIGVTHLGDMIIKEWGDEAQALADYIKNHEE